MFRRFLRRRTPRYAWAPVIDFSDRRIAAMLFLLGKR